MRKQPSRPTNDITQQYNSGNIKIFSVRDAARPGVKPKKELVQKCKLRFEERKLGLQRHYLFSQNMVEVERVIRCQYQSSVSSQDVVIDQFGTPYRIDLIQLAEGVYPKSMDITLSRYDQDFEVRDNEMV